MKTINKILILIFLSISITACLKDKNVDSQQYGLINLDAKKIIEIPLHSGSVAIPIKDKDTIINIIDVRLASKDVSSEDLVVELGFDRSNKMIDDYNTLNEANLVPFPPALYSLLSGYKVTIPKGSNNANLQIKVNSSKYDLSESYAMGFYIKSVDKPGYTLSGNFDTILVQIGAKNKYDGVYTVTGTSLRAGDVNLSGPIRDGTTRDVVTTGLFSITYHPPWADGSDIGGIAGTTITIDPATNKVTMSSDNPKLVNLSSFDNRYDPATKTFYLSYYWGNGPTHRAATHTLVFKKQRD